MTIRELLILGRKELNDWGGTDTVELDSSLILGHVLKIRREQLLARFTDTISQESSEEFLALIEKRCQNYPVAYLTGVREFFGRDFKVARGVLCPRPDTEIIIEKALELLDGNPPSAPLLDLCSGSGCIGLTIALEKGDSSIICADIDGAPQRAFEENKRLLHAHNADFIRSDLFKNLTGPFAMILTNPPYLTTEETQNRMNDDWIEPALALDGGPDGLDLIRKIIHESIDYLAPEGYLLVEAAPSQMVAMESLMIESGFNNVDTVLDLAGYKRVMYGRR
jgi:release factor glutamine methyltransferase